MKRVAALAAFLLTASVALAAKGPDGDPRVLLTRYKCYICHADGETKAGPAYRDVAAHYRGRRDAVATIAREIRQGRHGAGPWHMPPHPEVAAAEARAIARYIMSLSQ
jgi:cytochrome c